MKIYFQEDKIVLVPNTRVRESHKNTTENRVLKNEMIQRLAVIICNNNILCVQHFVKCFNYTLIPIVVNAEVKITLSR